MNTLSGNDSSRNNFIIGCLFAIASETSYGLSYVFTKFATGSVSGITLLGWRFVTAAVIIVALRALGVIKVNLKGKDLKPVFLVSAFCPIFYFIAETIGISRTTASESGVLLACIPVASFIASALILKKKPTKIQICGIFITLAGVTITVVAVGITASLSVIGYIMLVAAVVSYALYCVYVEKAAEFTSAELTYVMMLTGAVVFMGCSVISSAVNHQLLEMLTLPFNDTGFLISVLYQGLGSSVLGFMFGAAAIARVGVNTEASFVGISTVVSVLSGIVFLKEEFSLLQIIGLVIIIAGVYTANSKGGNQGEN